MGESHYCDMGKNPNYLLPLLAYSEKPELSSAVARI
jgi:hypothetical protein